MTNIIRLEDILRHKLPKQEFIKSDFPIIEGRIIRTRGIDDYNGNLTSNTVFISKAVENSEKFKEIVEYIRDGRSYEDVYASMTSLAFIPLPLNPCVVNGANFRTYTVPLSKYTNYFFEVLSEDNDSMLVKELVKAVRGDFPLDPGYSYSCLLKK